MRKTVFMLFALAGTPAILLAVVDFAVIEHSCVEVDFSRMSGHHVSVDGIYTNDWKGALPAEWNTFVYLSNQYIYADALNDDRGDGDYAYPWNGRFKDGMADITELRIAYDSTNLYFLVKMWEASPDPDGWWVNAVLIGIADDDSSTGNAYLIEGDGKDPDQGPAAEISTTFKVDYTIFAASTYRIRMWNAKGEKIGDGTDPSDGSMNNMKVKGAEWNKYEISVPLSLIGPVQNKKYRFIAGACFEEGQMAREVQGYPLYTEWYITGGDPMWWNSLAPDPDVMDLVGASQEVQEKELGSYLRLFNNTQTNFEIFNADIRPYIFSPDENEEIRIFFTLSGRTKVTINIRDLDNRLIRNVIDSKEVVPVSSMLPVEYTWNGRDDGNAVLRRGVYIVEFIFTSGREKKVIRKAARIW
ncbi:MAG: glucodextranase DOMON-like domain-containing protein [bacterium]|nr:glucodextranase DOMON-like domain-containing protein [bacterium]